MKSSFLYALLVWLIATFIGPLIFVALMDRSALGDDAFSPGDIYTIFTLSSIFFSWPGFLIMIYCHRAVLKRNRSALSSRLWLSLLGIMTTLIVFLGPAGAAGPFQFEWKLVIPYALAVLLATMTIPPVPRKTTEEAH